MKTDIQFIDDQTLIAQADQLKDAIIIDIRSPSEYAGEHVLGSVNIPLDQLSQHDTSAWKDKTLIFHCKSGHRTQQARLLIENIACRHKLCLGGGLEQWKRCGLATHIDQKAPLALMRQVQILVGSLIILGVVLTVLLSPYFILLPFFVGCGLLVAGVTGFCGMANLLMLLPYNKPRSI